MILTDKGHFKITFENGYTVSVVNGFGSYSQNHFNTDLLTETFSPITSQDCEIAILYNGNFVTRKFLDIQDDVYAYVKPDEVADIIYNVKNYKEDKYGYN